MTIKAPKMAATCFGPPSSAAATGDEDSIILFSPSNSPDEEFSSASSSFSSQARDPYPEISYKLSVFNLSYSINPIPSSPFPLFPRLFQEPNPIKILNSVSFAAESSEILAVVGPSGTGKSTLLKIVSGRVNHKELDPEAAILINDRNIRNLSQLRRICGFVPQDDDLLPLLTVKETLMYSAKFSLRDSMTPRERVRVKDSFVGEGDEEDRGVSGGERKRVSIAIEMIRDPPILLLDEPTSGLDSRNSLQVIELLAFVAKSRRRTVVLSIHQPSYRILDYISSFLILSRGSVIHFGNLGSLEESIVKIGFQIPAQLNPLEFAMEIVDSLRNSNSGATQIADNPHPIWQPEEENEDDRIKHRYPLLDIAEIALLCSRFWKIIYRTKQLFLARTMQALVGGFGLASVYVKLRRDEAGVAERLGLFAFSLSFLLSSTVEALPIYLHERRIVMKESSVGCYRISSYIIANTIAFTPFLFVVSLLFSIPVYWIVGLNPSIQAFAFFILVVWLIVQMASSLVLFLSAVSPDFISGNSLICTVLGAFFLFSGYFIPKESIPKPWMFMYYVSLYRYPLDTMVVNEYWSLRGECFSWRGDAPSQQTCEMTGEEVLRSRGLERDTRWMNVGIMFGFFLFYRLLCWAILLRKSKSVSS
ncbi:PREDICTED: ABC transporter G family member 23 [Tarenaya hassleriana]|uniref:ABC transporter G family member 23 n=1 Tax=Tarenaya hassleriana TaxID=28532 RepID=UPI00053C4D35|nr:PREDICTED: ABC transporter G family member 23 [Tarenaya hassleriana]